MVLCDECHKNIATIHVTKIVNNTASKLHLCQECAQRLSGGSSFDIFLNLPKMLAEIFGVQEVGEIQLPKEKILVCENCGMNLSEVIETGKLGCSRCYETFKEAIEPLIKKIHGSETHVGKVPPQLSKEARIKIEIRGLKSLLKKYVDKEEYEQAARIRDEIKKLEGELLSTGRM